MSVFPNDNEASSHFAIVTQNRHSASSELSRKGMKDAGSSRGVGMEGVGERCRLTNFNSCTLIRRLEPRLN